MERLCNAEGPQVTRTERHEEEHIRTTILDNWPHARKGSRDFPGPQPVSMERKDLCKLSQFPYMVAEKTDGMRFLFLTGPDGAFFIDRAFRVYSARCVPTHTRADQSACGTVPATHPAKLSIFDGELVQEHGGDWSYYAHDAVIVSGVSVATKNLRERLRAIERELGSGTPLPECTPVCIRFVIKKMTPIAEFDFSASLGAGHDVDGLILTPVNKPVETGTQYSMYKWKSADQQTMDFLVIPKTRRYELWVYDKNELVKFATYSTKTGKGRTFENGIPATCKIPKDGEVLECKYYKECYIPLKARPDKSRPNSLRTIQKTIIGIQENITLRDLEQQTQFGLKQGVRGVEPVQPYRDPFLSDGQASYQP